VQLIILAEHAEKTKHHICIEEVWVIVRVDHFFHRKFREAIDKKPCNLNKDDGISDHLIPTLSSTTMFL